MTDVKRKKQALLTLMKHETGSEQFEIEEKHILATGIIQVEVKQMTAKEKNN